MPEQRCVIIGNGPAANEAAITLRENAPDMRITIIGAERSGHYRAYLLPDFVCGKVAEESLYVHPPAFYRERNLHLRLGQSVVNIDFHACKITLDHKEVLTYDGLVLAVGSKPRIPEPLLIFEDLMLTLKTVRDAHIWRERLTEVDSALIIGGDLTSLSFANALLTMGKQVKFMLNEDSFWPVRCTEKILSEASEKLRAKGVDVILSNKIKGIAQEKDDRFHVETNARNFHIGLIGAFFGLRPNVKFLAKTGVLLEKGILVDKYLRTGFENVYAAGDCAQVYHPEFKDYWVSIGYRNARNLGRTAALNLLGGKFQADVAAKNIFEVDGIVVNTSWWTEF